RRTGRRRQPARGHSGHVGRSAPQAGRMSRLLRDRRAAFGGSVLLMVLLCAALAPLVTTGDPASPRDIVATRFVAPLSSDAHGVFHPLGTDRFGRDVWTRLVYGARISMGIGVLAVLVSLAVGIVVGAVAGYWRGPASLALLGLTDFALAVPRVVLLLLLAAVWEPGAALGVAGPRLTRRVGDAPPGR